jgi:hypothetical protein
MGRLVSLVDGISPPILTPVQRADGAVNVMKKNARLPKWRDHPRAGTPDN